jgi:8-oxo-dGTP pyrophosphatase MutT (NUDIX family)
MPSNREFSSGGIVYRIRKTSKDTSIVEWLITRSNPSELYPLSYWRFPKGWIDDGENGNPGPLASGLKKATDEQLQNAAIREVREEGGVEVRVVEKIGTIKYSFKIQNKQILKFVTFYLMEWVRDLDSGFGYETAEIDWLPFDRAQKTLRFVREKEMLKKADNILQKLL